MDRTSMLSTLAEREFDLLIVGGGITGAGVAREASLRGLRVGLVEQLDFAYGTSSRSTKLIHGGLRYLKRFDFKLVHEAVEERQRLLEMAPHLVQVTPFVFPVYRGDPDSLLMLRIGLSIYDLFAGLKAAVPHRIFRGQRILRYEPGLRREHLVGGAIYTDSRTDDGRLTLDVMQSAADLGATVANYVEVQSFRRDAGGRLTGASARDTLGGEALEIRAGRVLAAVGPWADELRRLDDPSAPPILRLTKGVHVTVSRQRLPLRNAVVMRGRDERVMFAVPSGGYSYLGTTDTEYEGPPGDELADRSDVEYILDAANHSFPEARLTDADVVSTWVGVRPLIRPRDDASPSSISRDYALFSSPSGLVTVGGGKLTAFRAMASHIVDDLFPETRRNRNRAVSIAPLPGADGPLPGADDFSRLGQRLGISPLLARQWGWEYGTALRRVVELLPEGPISDPARAWFSAATRHAVRAEMAQRLEDVYRRRTGLMLFTDDNGRRLIEPLADEMAGLLGWSAQRKQEEVADCRSRIERMFAWRQEPAGATAGLFQAGDPARREAARGR